MRTRMPAPHQRRKADGREHRSEHAPAPRRLSVPDRRQQRGGSPLRTGTERPQRQLDEKRCIAEHARFRERLITANRRGKTRSRPIGTRVRERAHTRTRGRRPGRARPDRQRRREGKPGRGGASPRLLRFSQGRMFSYNLITWGRDKRCSPWGTLGRASSALLRPPTVISDPRRTAQTPHVPNGSSQESPAKTKQQCTGSGVCLSWLLRMPLGLKPMA